MLDTLEFDTQRLLDSASVPGTSTVRGGGDFNAGAGDRKRQSAPGYIKKISLVPWNSNGLLGIDTEKSAKKSEFLRRLINNYDVVMVQETHVATGVCERMASDLDHVCDVQHSISDSQVLAGVAFHEAVFMRKGAGASHA